MDILLTVLGLLFVTLYGCHGSLQVDTDPWTLQTDYPSDVSFDKSGLFYSIRIDSTTVPWNAGRAYCAEVLGPAASLYEPHDRAELDHVHRTWLAPELSARDLASLPVWTGLSKFEGKWAWLGKEGNLLPDSWKDSGIGACAAWDVVSNSWLDTHCDAIHSVLCKTVNHYREVYHGPDVDAMAAFVVDSKNHTQATGDCGNYGYQLFSVDTREAKAFLSGLFNRMKSLTAFSIPKVYWINSHNSNDGQCFGWNAEGGHTSAFDCGEKISYTCSYRHSPDQNTLSASGKSSPQSTFRPDSPALLHKARRKRSTAGQAAVDQSLESHEQPMEAPGSATIGLVTIAIISTVGVLLFISDIPTIYISLRGAFGNMASFCGCGCAAQTYQAADTADSNARKAQKSAQKL